MQACVPLDHFTSFNSNKKPLLMADFGAVDTMVTSGIPVLQELVCPMCGRPVKHKEPLQCVSHPGVTLVSCLDSTDLLHGAQEDLGKRGPAGSPG